MKALNSVPSVEKKKGGGDWNHYFIDFSEILEVYLVILLLVFTRNCGEYSYLP